MNSPVPLSPIPSILCKVDHSPRLPFNPRGCELQEEEEEEEEEEDGSISLSARVGEDQRHQAPENECEPENYLRIDDEGSFLFDGNKPNLQDCFSTSTPAQPEVPVNE